MMFRLSIAALLGPLALSAVLAQESPSDNQVQNAKQLVYFPLFSEEMISNASPGESRRMRSTEDRNRKKFEERQQILRERNEDEVEPDSAAQRAPAPNAPRAKSKIFKWVDGDGRVHFGDAPQGSNAKEVKVGGAARIQGTPPPPPNTKSDSD